MNQRALVTLGLLLAASAKGGPSGAVGGLHQRLREFQNRDPMNAVLTTVLGAAAAFYAVERGHNPKVKTYYDALVYVSTNLSVGYSDILASTPAGKLVGSLLMAYGPSLSDRAFDAPAAQATAAETEQPANVALREIACKLEAILGELRARPLAGS